MVDNKQAGAVDETILDSVKRTVQTVPSPALDSQPIDSLVMYFASAADPMPPWGSSVVQRDKLLRQFFIKEPMVAGAVFNIAAANAAFRWEIQCEDEQLREAVTRMLKASQFGDGWAPFISRLTVDLLTQDNGAFIEVIRDGVGPAAPVVNLAALEANRCIRTGNPKTPVQYDDQESEKHLLNWYDVVPLVEMPSNIETMRGMQYSALSRLLTAAQIMRDIEIYRGEKVGGRFQRVLHIVGGPARNDIKKALQMDEEDADNRGLTRFMMPTILASLDPSKPVTHVEIPLASLPDNFSLEDEMKWFITTMALAFARDYQDFAPLPGGNLGTSNQSEILHKKSRGKGPSLFMEIIDYAVNMRGLIPYPTTKFVFRELDLEAEFDKARIRRTRSEARGAMIKSGEITPEAARMMAIQEGDYDAKVVAEIERTEEARHQRAVEDAERAMSLANARRGASRSEAAGRTPEQVKEVLRTLRPF
jgi:hypothetical protein